MDPDALPEPQRQVVVDLFAWDQRHERPVFDRDLPVRLRDALEAGLAPAAERLGVGEIAVAKRDLANVLACERHHVADREAGFGGWTPATARGKVVHKAIELHVGLTERLAPLDLVDAAIDRLKERESGLAQWLDTASPADRAELRTAANDAVVKFLECWPPLQRSWVPRTESPVRIDICEERITLRGTVDLMLGKAEGTQARVLMVDLKTGAPQPGHLDDLRFYALLHTIRTGVPPFRLAAYYLDSGRYHAEDVSEDLLAQAAGRVVDGVSRIVELHLGDREPAVSPGPRCGWCAAAAECPGAAAWRHQRASRGDDPDALP